MFLMIAEKKTVEETVDMPMISDTQTPCDDSVMKICTRICGYLII